MISGDVSPEEVRFLPVTAERWADFESLLGECGAWEGCWCMWWRLTRREWSRLKGEGNRQAMKRIVESGEVPGIIAYIGGKPAGWCSVAPREAFPSLNRSPTLKRVDGEPVWSIVCFYVPPQFRGVGLMPRLLVAARDYAVSRSEDSRGVPAGAEGPAGAAGLHGRCACVRQGGLRRGAAPLSQAAHHALPRLGSSLSGSVCRRRRSPPSGITPRLSPRPGRGARVILWGGENSLK